MQSIRNLEYQQCRVCYDSTNNLQLLTSFAESSAVVADKTYAQLLLEVCGINVINDKPFGSWPQFICFNCARKLIIAYDFIQHTLKINKLLQSIADLLQVRCESNFIETPALDIPLEIKDEKDDDMDLPSNERKFQYSPSEVEVVKVLPSSHTNEIYNNFPCTNNTSKEYTITNNRINNGCFNENIKEILVPSTIEFISDDVIIKDDLEKFHRKIINTMDLTNQNPDTDFTCLDDNLLCVSESKPSNTLADVVYNNRNKCVSNEWNLDCHKRLAHTSEDQETYCTICSQNFTRPYTYQKHMKHVHEGKICKQKQITPMPKSKKIIQHSKCTEKIKKNTNKKKLLEDFPCSICKKKFPTLSRLIRHKRYTHISEEEKITCDWCGNKYARPDNYQSHVRRVHNKKFVFRNKVPTDIQSLKYDCSKCDRSYLRPTLLIKHEKDIHGRKKNY